jgi:hypothetical protein
MSHLFLSRKIEGVNAWAGVWEWRDYRDWRSGRRFYVNVLTGAKQWHRPRRRLFRRSDDREEEEGGGTPAADGGSRARSLGLLQPRQHSY